VRWSRPIEGTPKTVAISQEADGWYVCFSCADIPVQPLPTTGQATGIDLGLEAFATTSRGERIFYPGWYRKAERALKTAQRRVSRRKQGSNRRRKAVKLLAKAHLKVKRQRADFHHTVARRLVQTHDTIYDEDLRERPTCSRTTTSPSRLPTRAGWLACVVEHPRSQSSIRWASSGSRAACLHQPDVLWLRRHRPERLIRPLA